MVECPHRDFRHISHSPLRAAAFAASLGPKSYGAATAARHPGDRSPEVPAVFRCRARQHHDQADARVPAVPGAVKMS